MNKCKTCGKPTNRPKFCTDACQRKYWKLTNRERYLLGKKDYRDKHRGKILEYNKIYKRIKKNDE